MTTRQVRPGRSQRFKRLLQLLDSVKFRLTLWYIAILGLVLIFFGAIVYFILANSLRSGLDNLLQSRASQFAATYNINNGQLNLPGSDEASAVLLSEDEIALLINSQGKLVQKIGQINPADIATLISKSEAATSASTNNSFYDYQLAAIPAKGEDVTSLKYRIYSSPITENGQVVGLLVVGRSSEAVAETLQNLLLILLLATPAALLLSAVGGYWLAGRTMQPVRVITRTARQIGETDLSRRLNLKRNDELGELASTFDQMLSRLERAFKRQHQFTADASHELRTPLTVVNLEVSRALSHERTSKEYQQALSIIQLENNYMTRLVNNLLMLARADANQNSLQLETLDLSYLILEVLERLTPIAHEKGVELANGKLPELEVTGDHLYLTRMLTNLLENAIKYTSGIGKLVKVEAGMGKTGWAWVRISDDGPGIALEHLPHLFDRFYQVDKARADEQSLSYYDPEGLTESKGSGLGLAIVQWIAQMHGGKVTVASQVGKGTTFEVELPLANKEANNEA